MKRKDPESGILIHIFNLIVSFDEEKKPSSEIKTEGRRRTLDKLLVPSTEIKKETMKLPKTPTVIIRRSNRFPPLLLLLMTSLILCSFVGIGVVAEKEIELATIRRETEGRNVDVLEEGPPLAAADDNNVAPQAGGAGGSVGSNSSSQRLLRGLSGSVGWGKGGSKSKAPRTATSKSPKSSKSLRYVLCPVFSNRYRTSSAIVSHAQDASIASSSPFLLRRYGMVT